MNNNNEDIMMVIVGVIIITSLITIFFLMRSVNGVNSEICQQLHPKNTSAYLKCKGGEIEKNIKLIKQIDNEER